MKTWCCIMRLLLVRSYGKIYRFRSRVISWLNSLELLRWLFCWWLLFASSWKLANGNTSYENKRWNNRRIRVVLGSSIWSNRCLWLWWSCLLICCWGSSSKHSSISRNITPTRGMSPPSVSTTRWCLSSILASWSTLCIYAMTLVLHNWCLHCLPTLAIISSSTIFICYWCSTPYSILFTK